MEPQRREERRERTEGSPLCVHRVSAVPFHRPTARSLRIFTLRFPTMKPNLPSVRPLRTAQPGLVLLALLVLPFWVNAAKPKLSDFFRPEKLAEIGQTVTNAINEKRLPGGVVWIERNGVAFHQAYGQRALVPQTEPMTEDTVFDLASLTKVVATAPSIMLLVERGEIDVEARVQDYIPDDPFEPANLVRPRPRGDVGLRETSPEHAASYCAVSQMATQDGGAQRSPIGTLYRSIRSFAP